jgi:hypothetical protein
VYGERDASIEVEALGGKVRYSARSGERQRRSLEDLLT